MANCLLRFLSICLLFSTTNRTAWPMPAPTPLPPLSASAAAPTAAPLLGSDRAQPTLSPAAVSAPRVVSHSVVSEAAAARWPVFAIRFSRPMDPASVAAALSVKPAVAFDLSWNDPSDEARLAVREPLSPQTTYTITLTSAAASLAGLPLAPAIAWTYRPRPIVGGTQFPASALSTTPITINFNYPLQRRSLEAAFRLEPALAGQVRLADDGLRLTFTPAHSLPHSTRFTVSFAGPVFDARGDAVPDLGPFTFTTLPPIRETSPAAGARATPGTAIQIEFDRPMDPTTTAAALTLQPATPGRITWEGATLIFTPESGYLTASTRYTVSLGTSARTAAGEPLFTEPYRFNFSTGPYEQSVSFGSGPHAQVLDAGGRRAVQFVLTAPREYGRLQFDLYGLPDAQLVEWLAASLGAGAETAGPALSSAGLPLVHTWGVDPADPPVGLEYADWLAETVIPAEVPPGAYMLEVRAGVVHDRLLILLTHYTLVVKQAGSQVLAWATDFQGAPAAGAEVAVYTRGGERLAAGTTEAAGLFRLETAGGPQPWLVLVQTAGELTAAGLGSEWRSGAGFWGSWQEPAPAVPAYTLHVYTDRPLYRPGQTVFFKAIVRRDADAVLSLPPTGTTLTARLRDARQNVVRTIYLFTNEFGTVSSLFRLAEGAMLGDYTLELTLDGETFRQTFQVQDYRPPDYAVSVSTDQSRYVAGQTIQAAVDSGYFFGQPVAGAAVKLKVYELVAGDCWPTCSSEPAWYEIYSQPVLTATTDAEGRAMFTLPAGLGPYGQMEAGGLEVQHSRLALEATVDDGSRQAVSAFAVAEVFSAGLLLSLDTAGGPPAPGAPFTARVAARSITGAPVAGQALTLQLLRWDDGRASYTAVVQAWEVQTGAGGDAELVLSVDQAGFYQLRVSGPDSRGTVVIADTGLAVFDEGVSPGGAAGRALGLSAERTAYAPGETADLLIESAFDGPALLTFERGTVRREQVVALTPPLTRVPMTVQPEDAPNLVVSVSAWQPLSATLTARSDFSFDGRQLRTASLNLSVPAADRQLTVTLTPDRAEYAPRETATVRVRVTDAAGQPVAAEVSLALVDEALFSLSPERSGSIFAAFYHARPALVRTFDALALKRWLTLWGEGGCGGGDDDPPAANPRQAFPDTALWEPNLVTDANGEALLTVTLPDTLTSWRLTAKAVTAAHQVGEARLNLLTRQPIVVRPLLPRTLTAGDAFELSAIVHNFSGAAQDVVVSLRAGGRLTVAGALTQTLRLAAGGQQLVGWPVTAAQAGAALLTVAAEAVPAADGAAGGQDAVQLPLTIQPLAVPEVTTLVGELTAGGLFTATLPWPADALAMSTVRLELSRSIAGSMLTGLAYLTGFPYGCVEQTMSKALPNAVVGRAFQQLGAGGPAAPADLPAKIDASVQRLYGFQHLDGGWGWWYDDDTDAYQTAWVVFGLALTAQAGYEVDSGVIRAGVEWLTDNLGQMDARTRAFALYSLAVAGYGEVGPARALALQAAQLDTFSRAGLALALHTLGARADAEALLGRLIDSAVQRGELVYWPDAQTDGHYRAKTMSSTTRSTALALSALVAIAPEHSLIPGVVRYLMSQRQASGWGSTNETSFTLLALTDYLLTQTAGAADTGYTVELNGQILAAGQLGRGRPSAVLELAAGQLRAGGNVLRLAPGGAGRLYYVITQRLYRPQAAVAAAGAIRLERRYLDPATHQPITGTIAAGQLVQVLLTVDLPRLGAYLLVEDHLPGGLEALNESLSITSHDAAADYGCYSGWAGCQGLNWRRYGYNNKEVRGDRVAFFITELLAGRATLAYLARATRAGAFVALPAEASAMYDASLWGRSASAEVTIEK